MSSLLWRPFCTMDGMMLYLDDPSSSDLVLFQIDISFKKVWYLILVWVIYYKLKNSKFVGWSYLCFLCDPDRRRNDRSISG